LEVLKWIPIGALAHLIRHFAPPACKDWSHEESTTYTNYYRLPPSATNLAKLESLLTCRAMLFLRKKSIDLAKELTQIFRLLFPSGRTGGSESKARGVAGSAERESSIRATTEPELHALNAFSASRANRTICRSI
jgi:hypothetical protein